MSKKASVYFLRRNKKYMVCMEDIERVYIQPKKKSPPLPKYISHKRKAPIGF